MAPGRRVSFDVAREPQPSKNAVRQAAPRGSSHRLKAQSKQLAHQRTDGGGVSPSHYNLKDIVQAIELDAAWYLNTPPDCRIAAPQGDFEFVDG